MNARRTVIFAWLLYVGVGQAAAQQTNGPVVSSSDQLQVMGGSDPQTWVCTPTCYYVSVSRVSNIGFPDAYTVGVGAHDDSYSYLFSYWGELQVDRYQANTAQWQIAGKFTIPPGAMFGGQEAKLSVACDLKGGPDGGFHFKTLANGHGTYGDGLINWHTTDFRASGNCKVAVDTVGLSFGGSSGGSMYSMTTMNIPH